MKKYQKREEDERLKQLLGDLYDPDYYSESDTRSGSTLGRDCSPHVPAMSKGNLRTKEE